MAQFKQCASGHYYDAEIYQSCPYCGLEAAKPDVQHCSMALKERTLLHGRYCVQDVIGEGGFSFIYLAEDLVLELTVALKECFPMGAASRASDGLCVSVSPEKQTEFKAHQTRMQRVGRAIARLSRGRKHLSPIYDIFEENDTTYLVMEYIPGQTLKQYMDRRGGRLELFEAKELLLPVLDELKGLHQRGFIHRDIAPDNCIVSDEKQAVLIDYDSARLPGEEKNEAHVVLKHGFSPPEQYQRYGEEGPWTDDYAFAATFYYTITGKVPPNAIDRMREDKLNPPSALGIRIFSDVEAALLRMLSLSPDDRGPAVSDFCLALSKATAWRPEPVGLPNIAEPFASSVCLHSYPVFSAEPFASTCACPPWEASFTTPLAAPNQSILEPVPQAVSPGEAMPAPAAPAHKVSTGGGLFSKLFRKKKSTEVQAAGCDDVGKTELCVAEDPPSSAPLRTADVEFSALFPKRFIKGEYSVLEMYMYEENQRSILDRALEEAGGALRESRASAFQIAGESTVSIRLESADPSVRIEGNDESQIWRGRYLKFDFAVFLEESYPKRQLMFTATVFINHVPATRLRFTAECNTLREQKMELLRDDILSAFVSYASQDRSRVATIIQGMKKARPEMDVFFDVDSLRSGTDWQQALRAEIERRDILFLCWSLSAKKSEWVDKEWRFALENRGLSFIEPIPIDPPSICPPPAELASKCFTDRDLYYIER